MIFLCLFIFFLPYFVSINNFIKLYFITFQ
nr:MAG TPA: hypothetical protein [Caudoviricetes sp.]